MNKNTKHTLIVLQIAILLGILGNSLFRQNEAGLSIFMWLLMFASAFLGVVVLRRGNLPGSGDLALLGAVAFLSFTFVWRDSPQLLVFNVLTILLILVALAMPALKLNTRFAGAVHYLVSGVWIALNGAFGPFLVFIDDIKWGSLPKTRILSSVAPVLKGLVIAIPILGLFSLLMMSADARFEALIENTFFIPTEDVMSHIVFIGILSWGVLGFFRAATTDTAFSEAVNLPNAKDGDDVRPQVPSVTEHISEDPAADKNGDPPEGASEKEKTDKEESKSSFDWRNFDNSILPASVTLGRVEIGIILGLINLLFAVFVVIQIPYLFGGIEFVQNTEDFKLADYARRGFGELTAISLISLPLLLGCHWLIRKDDKLVGKLFAGLGTVYIGLLFVIMISAIQRLLLLSGIQGYGLTAPRLYSIAFVVLLAMIFVWFGLSVLRGARQHFAFGALWCVIFMVGSLNVFNPDDFIVRTNIDLMKQGRSFDAAYNSSLSADAVPALLGVIPELEGTHRSLVEKSVKREFCRYRRESTLTYNWSRNSSANIAAEYLGAAAECSAN